MTPELCPESLWERLCHEDATCTFYQTPAWYHIAARHYQAETVPFLFHFENTKACLPLLKKRHWGRDVYFCPFGTYSALVCPQQLGFEQLNGVASELKRLNVHLVSSPFTGNIVTFGKVIQSRTQVIDLTAADPENPMKNWEPDQKRRALLAQKNGVTVRPASSEDEWDKYYNLYKLSIQRWGKDATGSYPASLFKDIRRSLSGSPSMRLWLAEHDGEIGGGYLVFYHNGRAMLWHGAADQRFFALGTTQILYFTMITDARKRGFSIFDLMGSAGLAKLESFKGKFGAQTVEFTSSINRTGLFRLAAHFFRR